MFPLFQSQEYYTERVIAEEIVMKITDELEKDDLPEDRKKRKKLILQSIKYYYGF